MNFDSCCKQGNQLNVTGQQRCVGAGAGVAGGGPHPHAGLHRAAGLPERGGPHSGQPLLDDG